MDRKEKIKAYAGGIVIGLIAAPIIAFSFGWVVTSGTFAASVHEAKLETLAAACASRATAYRTTENITTDISGWGQREAREEIATRFAVTLPESGLDNEDVVDECADLLNA